MHIDLRFLGMADRTQTPASVKIQHRNPCVNLMHPSLQTFQHGKRLLLVRRFSKDLPVPHNNRIRAQDHHIAKMHFSCFQPGNRSLLRAFLFAPLHFLCHMLCLHQRQLSDDLLRACALVMLPRVTDYNLKLNPDLLQQFSSPWRSRAKNDPFFHTLRHSFPPIMRLPADSTMPEASPATAPWSQRSSP